MLNPDSHRRWMEYEKHGRPEWTISQITISREGAINDEQAALLQKYAYGDILEIGSFLGFSTIVLALVGKTVVSIDNHGIDPGDTRLSTLELFLKNMEEYGVHKKVITMVGNSQDILPRLGDQQFDFVFIDADHSREAVVRDSSDAHYLLKWGGMMAWHDYGEPGTPTRQGIDDFLREYPYTFIAQYQTLLICMKETNKGDFSSH